MTSSASRNHQTPKLMNPFRSLSQDLHMTYLMCSRFCHDMAAPLGAISIGLEMILESQKEDGPHALLHHSIQSALHKLELMRCLCGYGTSTNRPTLAEAKRIIEKSIDPSKYQVVWNAPINENIFGNAVRLYIAVFILILEAMPRWGVIAFNNDYSLTLTGPLIRFHDAILQALSEPTTLEALDSRSIIAHFAFCLSQDLKTHINFHFDKPNLVRICFR